MLADSSQRGAWPAARDRYNRSLAGLFGVLRCGPGSWQSRAEDLGTRISAADGAVDPDRIDALFPASEVDGKKLKARHQDEGIGLPLVGWKSTSPVGQPRPPFQLPNGLPYNVSAVLSFAGATPEWRFAKRWKEDSVRVGRAAHPLAADWSASNEFYWKMCQLDDLLLQNLLLPDRFSEETGLYFVTPYDPDKIPLVFVHGLVSSPDAFKNTINELAVEPWFRERYQIWLYSYPTGNPWVVSSMNFRKKMREACAYARSQGHVRNLRKMVVVGHSMGGIVTRSSVTDPGSTLYNGSFRKPVNQLTLPQDGRRLIEDAFLYEPLAEPSRVVFLAVPHRGSPMADMGVSLWASKLIQLPKTLTIGLLDSTLLAVGDVIRGADASGRLPTSINSLSPENPATRTLADMPLPRGIVFHSVIGDRGKGNTPQSSDGVVPYWSSHVRPVASELIVPSNHSVPDSPEAAAELKRILQLHLRTAR